MRIQGEHFDVHVNSMVSAGSGHSPCDDLGALHRNVPPTATASQRHLCCSPRGVTDKISAVGATPHSHRPRKLPATLVGHVQSHQSARLAKSHCLEFTPVSRKMVPSQNARIPTKRFIKGHILLATNPSVARPARKASSRSDGQKSQELDRAAHFFRSPLIWNSATDFPAMLLGTISV